MSVPRPAAIDLNALLVTRPLSFAAVHERVTQVLARADQDLQLGAMLMALAARPLRFEELHAACVAIRERARADWTQASREAINPSASRLWLTAAPEALPLAQSFALLRALGAGVACLPALISLDRIAWALASLGLGEPWIHLRWLAHPACPPRICVCVRSRDQVEMVARLAQALGAVRTVVVSLDAMHQVTHAYRGILERFDADPKQLHAQAMSPGAVHEGAPGDLLSFAQHHRSRAQIWLATLALWAGTDDDRSALVEQLRLSLMVAQPCKLATH